MTPRAARLKNGWLASPVAGRTAFLLVGAADLLGAD